MCVFSWWCWPSNIKSGRHHYNSETEYTIVCRSFCLNSIERNFFPHKKLVGSFKTKKKSNALENEINNANRPNEVVIECVLMRLSCRVLFMKRPNALVRRKIIHIKYLYIYIHIHIHPRFHTKSNKCGNGFKNNYNLIHNQTGRH